MITVIARVITMITPQTDFHKVTRLSLTTVSMTVAALVVWESRKKIQIFLPFLACQIIRYLWQKSSGQTYQCFVVQIHIGSNDEA